MHPHAGEKDPGCIRRLAARSGVSAPRLRLRRTFRPLPQSLRDRRREPVAQGPGDQHDLATVVRLVSHEISEHVSYVERKVTPDVGRRPRDGATRFTSKGEEPEDALAASLQGRHQLPAPDPSPVDTAGHRDSQFRPRVLIHMHRALCRWPAIMRIVRRDAPGTAAAHSPGGRCSTRKTVTRLLVRQVSRIVSRRSGITSTRAFDHGARPGARWSSVAQPYERLIVDRRHTHASPDSIERPWSPRRGRPSCRSREPRGRPPCRSKTR